MKGITTDRTSALLAVVACALVVCSALAVAPGGADAEDFTGDITFDQSNGELEVRIPNSSTGSFSGQSENVTIEIGDMNTTVEGQSPDSIGANYTYTVDPGEFANDFRGTNGTGTTVTVRHGENRSFSGTANIQYAAIGGGSFDNSNTTVRLALDQHFGIGSESQPPVRVDVGDESADVDAEYRPGESELILNRATLSRAGVLRSPQEITVSGREYVNSDTSVGVSADGTVSAVRLDGEESGVQFSSPFFENGETYVVNVNSAESEWRYVRTVDATGEGIVANSSALAAEESLTLTVEHDGAGTEVVSGETVRFRTNSVNGSVTRDVVTFNSTLDVEAENATVWVRNNGTIERSEARLNGSKQNLTLAEPEVLPGDRNQIGLLIQFDGEPSLLYATVTLQDIGTTEEPASSEGVLATLLGNRLVKIGIFVILGVVVVAGGVYAGLAVFGSGGTRLNLFGESSKSQSSNESPAAETATVSFEVVDELAGRTYREADQVIARRNNGTQSGLGSGGAVGSGRNAGRNAGRNTGSRGGPGGVNTGSGERIDLSAGEGDTELSYGEWTFEVVEKNQTVARGSKEIRYDSGGLTHIPLSIEPYTVEVQVTEGPERSPAERAEVTVTGDIEWPQSPKRTDPNGNVQFKIPRSASRVTFTARTETAQPVEADYRVDQAVQDGVNLAVGAETGKIVIETRVGERPWPGVDVRLTPVSEDAAAYANEETVTTDSNGRRKGQNLPTGEYEVSAQPHLDGVETTAAVEPVTVRNDATTEVTLSIGVSYSMPEAYRDRLGDLRDRIGELTAATNRDVAIPRYYGTVLTSVLDLVDAVESSPERVVEAGISPDATIEALLDATEAGITAVGGAMSERRNVKLFGAAESMPPAEVDWGGTATLDAFLDQVTEGGERDRRALRDRLEETDGVLDQKWGEVNEIAPARKLHDRVGELARETGGIDDELTVVARVYVGICLLDAIEELFEHDALEERLNSGSY